MRESDEAIEWETIWESFLEFSSGGRHWKDATWLLADSAERLGLPEQGKIALLLKMAEAISSTDTVASDLFNILMSNHEFQEHYYKYAASRLI